MSSTLTINRQQIKDDLKTKIRVEINTTSTNRYIAKPMIILDPPEPVTSEEEHEAAMERARKKMPSNEELLKLADKFPAPQEWYDE